MRIVDYSKADIEIKENIISVEDSIKKTIGKQIEQCEKLLDYAIETSLNKSTLLFLSLFRTELIFKYKTDQFKMIHRLDDLYKEMIISNPIMSNDFNEKIFNRVLKSVCDEAVAGYDIRSRYADLKYNLTKDGKIIFKNNESDRAFIESINKLNNCIVY